MVGVIFFITTLILFANSDKVARSDVPMLAIAKEVNPIFATLYALVIFGLIFNTAFSLYYALGKRFLAGSDKRFKFFVAGLCPVWFFYIFYGFPSTGGSYVSHYWLSGVVDVGCPSCS